MEDLEKTPVGEKSRRGQNRTNFVLINVVGKNRIEVLNTDYVKRAYSDDEGVTVLHIHDEEKSYTIKVEQNIVDMFKKLRGVAI